MPSNTAGIHCDVRYLHVRELTCAVRSRRICDAAAEAGHPRSGQAENEKVRKPSRERTGQNDADVVGEQWGSAQELDRGREDSQAGEVLGERQRAIHRDQDRRAPPAGGERNRPRVPPQNPRVEDRVPEIVRDARGEVRRHRPGPDDSQEHEAEEAQERSGTKKSQTVNGKRLRFSCDRPIVRMSPRFPPIPPRSRSRIWDRSDNSVDRPLRSHSECAAANLY